MIRKVLAINTTDKFNCSCWLVPILKNDSYVCLVNNALDTKTTRCLAQHSHSKICCDVGILHYR